MIDGASGLRSEHRTSCLILLIVPLLLSEGEETGFAEPLSKKLQLSRNSSKTVAKIEPAAKPVRTSTGDDESTEGGDCNIKVLVDLISLRS
jgi:hypothetical protein